MTKLFKKLIAENVKPFIIAEVSANHKGSIALAKNTTAAKIRSKCCKNSNI